jgi:HD-GYP domain-containing protein (c-di-GMP phosphodiesterase class II)
MELWDPETASHSRRVARLVRGLLSELGCSGAEGESIIWAAAVHDVGKLAVSRAVLAKPGRLDGAERRAVERHAAMGGEWLARFPHLELIRESVRHHHERWDGGGYPDGLAGLEIPFGARVIAVADSFDAMTSNRPYRPAMSIHQAAAVLRVGRWQQWDGSLVDSFLRVIARQQAATPETWLACA